MFHDLCEVLEDNTTAWKFDLTTVTAVARIVECPFAANLGGDEETADHNSASVESYLLLPV